MALFIPFRQTVSDFCLNTTYSQLVFIILHILLYKYNTYSQHLVTFIQWIY